jgi:hypothetical protein
MPPVIPPPMAMACEVSTAILPGLLVVAGGLVTVTALVVATTEVISVLVRAGSAVDSVVSPSEPLVSTYYR